MECWPPVPLLQVLCARGFLQRLGSAPLALEAQTHSRPLGSLMPENPQAEKGVGGQAGPLTLAGEPAVIVQWGSCLGRGRPLQFL